MLCLSCTGGRAGRVNLSRFVPAGFPPGSFFVHCRRRHLRCGLRMFVLPGVGKLAEVIDASGPQMPRAANPHKPGGAQLHADPGPSCAPISKDEQTVHKTVSSGSPRNVEHWSRTTLREKLVKIGAKVTRNAKYVTFRLAEVAGPRRMFATILDRIALLGIPPPSASGCPN